MFALALAPSTVEGAIRVPLDYAHPGSGSASIAYEMAAPLDRKKPTVLVIADGQQFYVRKGRIGAIARDFGPGFNVVGLIGRADAPAIARACRRRDGSPDWVKAWSFYGSSQWVEDIESLRRRLAGPTGKVLLHGVSGGALLVHEYLAKHGDRVLRAFTAAALMPYLEPEFAHGTPTFLRSLGERAPDLPALLERVLEAHPADRPALATVFQRQHFFVAPEALSAARETLVRELNDRYGETLAKTRADYQVDAVFALERSDADFPIAVREYEFLAASGRLDAPSVDRFDPEFEAEYDVAKPLIEARRRGRVPLPGLDLRRLYRVETSVLILAGAQDRAVNYLTSISLAARYPNGHLLIVDDSHMFVHLDRQGLRTRLERAFLLDGTDSKPYREALASIEPFLWRGAD